MGGPREELQDGLLDTETVQQDQRDLRGGLHGAEAATEGGLSEARKAETKERDVGTGTSKDSL